MLLEFKLVVYLFGALLILTGIKIFFAPEKPLDPGNNAAIKFLRKFLPVTAELHGQRFFIKQGPQRFVTPLFLALVFVEMTGLEPVTYTLRTGGRVLAGVCLGVPNRATGRELWPGRRPCVERGGAP